MRLNVTPRSFVNRLMSVTHTVMIGQQGSNPHGLLTELVAVLYGSCTQTGLSHTHTDSLSACGKSHVNNAGGLQA